VSPSDLDLTELLHGAVDDVEPADRLPAIRAASAGRRPGGPGRPWLAAGGAALAAAAAVTAFTVLATAHHDDAGPARPAPTPTRTAETPSAHLVPLYAVGDTPRGPRLFREWDTAFGPAEPLQDAVEVLLQPPADPDYRTLWPSGSLEEAGFDGIGADGQISLVVDAAARDRPAGMSASDAELAVQQAVYTLQAAVGARAPVAFHIGGRPADRVLGIPVDGPVAQAPQTDVLSQVMISDPTEGRDVHGTFTARGTANSFEANVPWEVRDERGAVVLSGHATATGYGDRLYPWQARVDVSGLPSGFYTFVATTDDPSAGEGAGPDVDTRTIIVR
jgi:hypothetical protein